MSKVRWEPPVHECPECGSTNLEVIRVSDENRVVWLSWECLECEATSPNLEREEDCEQ